MKKFVINLKRRPDRLKQFQQRCPYQDVEVVPAFDGKNVELESKKERKLVGMFPPDRQPGAVGCHITHMRIWKRMINENIHMAMIFEDDCQFSHNFKEIMENLVMPEKLLILFPGGRFKPNFVMPPEGITKAYEHVYQHNYTNWNNRLHDRTFHCYILTYQLAKFLLNLTDITVNPEPVDHFVIHSMRDLKLPVHSTQPLIAWSPMVGDSDIR